MGATPKACTTRVEEELRSTRAELQDTIAQLGGRETRSLKAANEEATAV